MKDQLTVSALSLQYFIINSASSRKGIQSRLMMHQHSRTALPYYEGLGIYSFKRSFNGQIHLEYFIPSVFKKSVSLYLSSCTESHGKYGNKPEYVRCDTLFSSGIRGNPCICTYSKKAKNMQGFLEFFIRSEITGSIFFTHLFVWYSNEHLLPLNFKHFERFLQNLVQLEVTGRFHTAFVG